MTQSQSLLRKIPGAGFKRSLRNAGIRPELLKYLPTENVADDADKAPTIDNANPKGRGHNKPASTVNPEHGIRSIAATVWPRIKTIGAAIG